MPLNKIIPCPWMRWIGAAFVALFIFSAVKQAEAQPDPCRLVNNPPPFIVHDTNSYCELCTYGYITIRISNPYRVARMNNMTVREDLGASGLTWAGSAPGAATYRIGGGAFQPGPTPSVSGAILTWQNLPFELLPGEVLEIRFAVQRSSDPVGLVSADRHIEASLNYSTNQGCAVETESTGQDLLDLREPFPDVSKAGRNVDAAQTSYTGTVYGNNQDDVIWRISFANNSLATLQELHFTDIMGTGNLTVNYICPTQASAETIANNNGTAPSGSPCRTVTNNRIDNFDVDNPFGYIDNPDVVDVNRQSTSRIYLVGKVPTDGSCSPNTTNTVSGIQWGCEYQSPQRLISEDSNGNSPNDASAAMSTLSRYSGGYGLVVTPRITGTNTTQPAGSKGIVEIEIRNNTGGTIKGINFRNVLPAEYVVDPTYMPTVTILRPVNHGVYPGMINTVEWTNPAADTFPINTTDPNLLLSNTAPEFRLHSGASVNTPYPDQRDMLRHGFTAVVRFGIVLIEPSSYDKVANLDVRTEAPNSDPPGTDPNNVRTLSPVDRRLTNRLSITFTDFCDPGTTRNWPTNGNPLVSRHDSRPEDLDIDIVGSELLFILTNDPDQRLDLTVRLRNNGGHEARDYDAYVAFGATMHVITVPNGCSEIGNPPPLPIWREPSPIPLDASVYFCRRPGNATIQPGTYVDFPFQVIKSTDEDDLRADDLTFRADVVGQITLSDGTPLWFPPPTPRADGVTDPANNYSLDGIRARVIGFNLLKSQVGTCSENNPPENLPDREVQIGEECTFHIDTGGWFGFQTPGFSFIAVQDITVYDQLPDGQGYIWSSDPLLTSTPAIQGVSLNPADLEPLDDFWINWTFNTQVPEQQITERDHWFRVDMISRLLNDPLDLSGLPNRHAEPSTNVLNSTFQGVFYNDILDREEVYNLGPGTVGYPRAEVRTVVLTVTEPHLTMVKEVCNETLYGVGTACSNFVPLTDDGDALNSYIYRLRVSNEAAAAGVQRAPAYDVIVTDVLDSSGLARVLPFESDGLDNDGDGLIGVVDVDGEGTVINNDTPGVSAEITFSYTHSSALRRIDPGQSVELYYRVDFDDDAAPLQVFTNTATAAYDSLEGVSGSQRDPQGLNGEIGGARVYTSEPAEARVQIIPIETHPKRIVALSNTPAGSAPQPVSIGEEVEFRLNTLLPVALLREFAIRDYLPEGMMCAEAPVVDLTSAGPYADAGFEPGGIIVPTCSGRVVEWNFGNQRITRGTQGLNNRYNFAIGFIARIENTEQTNDTDVITNGHPEDSPTTVRYRDELGDLKESHFAPVSVLVREPQIVLTKSFAVDHADAGDILTVTVTAENTGTAPAYNLQVMDDLRGGNLLYFHEEAGGDNRPDYIVTDIANRPIFGWNPANPIAPGAVLTFTFKVLVATPAQPHEILANTIQARWTSLPGQTTALSSGASIGEDGAPDGMRNGALPNAGHTVNDYEATAEDALSVPPVTMSKTDIDPAVIPAIGAHKLFQIDIRLPEGTTGGLTVTDSLDAAGISYVLADYPGAEITYTFQGIATINGELPAAAFFNAVPPAGTSGSAVWDIGTVVTQTEDDTTQSIIAPLIRISYYARVNNDLQTDNGDSLSNAVAVAYTRGDTGFTETLTDATAAVIVVEPALTVAKAARNATPGKSGGDPAEGGDLLEYAITIYNAGTSTAHDVNVVDTLPAGLAFEAAFEPTALINGTAVIGFTATPLIEPGGRLIWGRENGDESLDIPSLQTLVLTYQVRVLEAGGELINRVWVDWTSLAGATGLSSYERTGAGCPDWTAPDDYCAGPASTTTPTIDNTRISKSIVDDTYDEQPPAAVPVARVGDTVTYRLSLDLRGGLTRDVRVEDLLPAGMEFVETVHINHDGSPDYTPPPSGPGSNFVYDPVGASAVPSALQTGLLTWTIGDIVNNGPGTQTFEIEYRARLVPDAGIPHIPSTTRANTASLHYLDAPALSDGSTVTVRQPVINQITKTAVGHTSPASVQLGTDIMQFHLETCNTTGQAPAYGLVLVDQLTAELDEVSIAGPVNGSGQPDITLNGVAGIEGAGADYIYIPPAARGGAMEFRFNTPINPGQCLTIDYNIGFHTIDVGENQVWNNSAAVQEYWSRPELPAQRYGPVGPAVFVMHNVVSGQFPPEKTTVSPVSGEITIGEEVVYRITVPGPQKNASMNDVVIIDVLNPNFEFMEAQEISSFGLTTTYDTVSNQVRMAIDSQIPANEHAVIELRARLRNVAGAQAGVSFTNTALYTFVDPSSGATGGDFGESPPILIVEPELTMTKSVENAGNPGQPPRAGDILRYTLSFTAAGGIAGDNFSDAFDLRIEDSLSLGLEFVAGSAAAPGYTIGDPVISGDGVSTAQTLVWGPGAGNADIDVPEGQTVHVTYEVRVLGNVLADQVLGNSAAAQWTGLDGISEYERNGTAVPAWNDYYTGPVTTELTTVDNTTFAKARLQDTYLVSEAVRIGDIVRYELRLGLPEGAHANVAVSDILPRGLIFEGTVAINGDDSLPYTAVAPFEHADITGTRITVTGDPALGPTTVTWNLGDILNPPDGNTGNDTFVIVYRARVLNDVHPHLHSLTLTNSAAMSYATAAGPAAPREDTETITVLQPELTVAKSVATAGGGTEIGAGELVTYTLIITNSGNAPAYDTVLRDIIPAGLRSGAQPVTVLEIALGSGEILPILAPVYDAATGTATWDFDAGTADRYTIPPGDSLRIVYQVQAEPGIGAGLTFTNRAWVQWYYSFDDDAVPTDHPAVGVRQIYGPTEPAETTLTSATPTALSKRNPEATTVAVGEIFSYRITVPAEPLAVALYDVRILDNLGDSAADLSFVGVTRVEGSQPWTPVNTGTATNLVIEDPVNGIDIPAGEQIVIEITVMLNDSSVNSSGLQFNNTADYTYNAIDGDPDMQAPGGPDTTPDMTIAGPDELTLEKSGPATMQVGTPGSFTLNLHNPSTGTAWNPTIIDILPREDTGGMCDAAPTDVTARIYMANGETPVSDPLVPGTHFETTFNADTCEWSLRLLSAAGGIAPDQRLIVTYQAALDASTGNGVELTNVAGVVRWYGIDPTPQGAAPRIYERELTNVIEDDLDHQDYHTVATQAPVLAVSKSVLNMTTGQNPGTDASPGDRLRYTIQIRNNGPVGLSPFAIMDEVDALNTLPIQPDPDDPPIYPPPAFAPGTLVLNLGLSSLPGGADTSGTTAVGGAAGTGLVSVGNLTIGAQGEAGDTITLVFEIQLAPVISSGRVVLNQARIDSELLGPILSDDPNLPGDVDPTETRITSAPHFEVLKTSEVIGGDDPDILMAGGVLRYTITIRNIGNENARTVTLRDYTPANTAYLRGSTTLNGAPVPDAPGGVNPLHAGMTVNVPGSGAGYVPAVAVAGANDTATITFDVIVDSNVMDGLVICNQGYVNGSGTGSGPVPEQPSDDPSTPAADDPTCRIVGNLPLLYAIKTVQIQQDSGTIGIVDPGDVLRYTIVISNFSATPGTGVVLTDAVPTHTTYEQDSLRLNGEPIGSDYGISPLIAGLSVHSPGNPPGSGIISPGQSAVVTFDVRVVVHAETGWIIQNQGTITSSEVPPDLTDADGVPANGRQPTIVVVGEVQRLAITKEVLVVGGGSAEPGRQLEYVIRVTNIGSLPATSVLVTDALGPLAGRVAYVDGSGIMNGVADGVSYTGTTLTADYGAVYGDLPAGAGFVVRFRVRIDAALPIGTTITNIGTVHWTGDSASAEVSIDVGGTPGSGVLNGRAWHDVNLDRVYDTTEMPLAGWAVELYHGTRLVSTVLTRTDGTYRFTGILPNEGTEETYSLRFRAPGANIHTASIGHADSPFTDGPQRISDINLTSGVNVQNMNLPAQPNGTIYNSVTRETIAGAQVSLLNATSGAALPAHCFDDPVQQNQVTAQNGFYKLDLNFSDPACPVGGAYLIEVTPPAGSDMEAPSRIIPPGNDATTPPFSVPACPGSSDDAVPATADYCEVTTYVTPPPSVPPRTAGTLYYLHLTLDDGHLPGHSQVFNNSIPIDPELAGAVAITKTTPLINVNRGSLVPYTITLTNIFGVPLYDTAIVDRFPAGFKYVAGSARRNGVPAEPQVNGRELVWDGLELQVNERQTLQLLLIVGSGVAEGEYVNRAHARNAITGELISGEATATVRVVPDPTFDCTDVIGKVFDDRNLNGQQDEGEKGLPGVRVVTARGLIANTDEHGRFHITCAAVPDEDRGSNFILKLDERSLPTGYRLTTENPFVQRATRGKMLRFNFGATIHRVVRLDIADGVFESETSDLRLQWKTRMGQLLEELKKAPSVLRLSYLADVEREDLVRKRLEALKNQIGREWKLTGGGYRLEVETEVFWRRGAPARGR